MSFFKDGLLREDFCKVFFDMTCDCRGSRIISIKDRSFDIRTYRIYDGLRWILVLRDVTEQRLMEERLKRVERLVSLGTMAGGIAHEINNPLTAVVGFTELLLIEETDEKRKDFLFQIMDSAKRIQRIVNDLLIFGRKGELRFEEVLLGDFINEVLKDFEDVRDIKIVKDFSYSGPVRIDRGLFDLVIRNLLNNAIQAIRDSGKGDRVGIRTSRHNGSIKIEIEDNGPGIPERILSRVFEPFFTTKEVGKGSGLGLSIAHNIVISHGGEISVRSKEGEGTVFTITLHAL